MRVGEVRPSAAVSQFGIGSVIDLPHLSVVVCGLDRWPVDLARDAIDEPRLVAAIQQAIPTVTALVRPPRSPGDDGGRVRARTTADVVGMPVLAFPRWLVCPRCRRLASLDSGLFLLKANRFAPHRTAYVHEACPKIGRGRPPIVHPVRFVSMCEHGHLDDFPWHAFVHRGAETACTGRFTLRDSGPSGEASEVRAYCDECGASNSMAQAFGDENRRALPPCTGRHPHLGTAEECTNPRGMRAMLLGASNSWFAAIRSSLTLPDGRSELEREVERLWEPTLRHVTNLEVLSAFRASGQLETLARYSDADVLAAVARRREPAGPAAAGDLQAEEWQRLAGAELPAHRDLTACAAELAPLAERYVERVVLVERLREVRALLGFTRIESTFDVEDDQVIVPLGPPPLTLLPAVEVRGEGIFLRFSEAAVSAWCALPSLRDREASLRAAHADWRTARNAPDPAAGFPGMRYVLLHTFSHALMRGLALEAGYAQASIRERIYARDTNADGGPMAGILLATAASDSEGTLGGLVAQGEREAFAEVLRASLAAAELCASDPFCAEHEPGPQGVHGAACHACLFAPETSCERGNRYLDRAVLATLVAGPDIAFHGR